MTFQKTILSVLIGFSSLFLIGCGSTPKETGKELLNGAENTLEEGIDDLDNIADDLIDEAKEILGDDEDTAGDEEANENDDDAEERDTNENNKEEESEPTEDKEEETVIEEEEAKEEVRVEKELPDAPSGTTDKATYESIIGGSRYTSNGDATSLFTFRGNNTFMFNVDGNDTQGEWTVEDGKILVGDEELQLEIIGENEIKINGITYKRNANDGV